MLLDLSYVDDMALLRCSWFSAVWFLCGDIHAWFTWWLIVDVTTISYVFIQIAW